MENKRQNEILTIGIVGPICSGKSEFMNLFQTISQNSDQFRELQIEEQTTANILDNLEIILSEKNLKLSQITGAQFKSFLDNQLDADELFGKKKINISGKFTQKYSDLEFVQPPAEYQDGNIYNQVKPYDFSHIYAESSNFKQRKRYLDQKEKWFPTKEDDTCDFQNGEQQQKSTVQNFHEQTENSNNNNSSSGNSQLTEKFEDEKYSPKKVLQNENIEGEEQDQEESEKLLNSFVNSVSLLSQNEEGTKGNEDIIHLKETIEKLLEKKSFHSFSGDFKQQLKDLISSFESESEIDSEILEKCGHINKTLSQKESNLEIQQYINEYLKQFKDKPKVEKQSRTKTYQQLCQEIQNSKVINNREKLQREFLDRTQVYFQQNQKKINWNIDICHKIIFQKWSVINIVHPIRYMKEIEHMKTRNFFHLISINAPLFDRWNRFQVKYEKFVKRNNFLIEHFVALDDYVLYKTETYQLIHKSNYSITNDKTYTYFCQQLQRKSNKIIRPYRPSWNTYFMTVAYALKARSNCVKASVGAVIVSNNRIVATGYNGTPSNTTNCYNFGCTDCNYNFTEKPQLDKCLCLHAEEASILEAGIQNTTNCTLYCTQFPCIWCSKSIIQAKIAKVIYHLPGTTDSESMAILCNYCDIQQVELNDILFHII